MAESCYIRAGQTPQPSSSQEAGRPDKKRKTRSQAAAQPHPAPARAKRSRKAASVPTESIHDHESDHADPSEQDQAEADDRQMVNMEASDSSGGSDDQRPAAKRRKTGKKQQRPPRPKKLPPSYVAPYIVPAIFDGSAFGDLELSSKKLALASLASALCKRFMVLREPVRPLSRILSHWHLSGSVIISTCCSNGCNTICSWLQV